MPRPVPAQASAGFTDGGLPCMPDGDRGPGLAGVVDLGDLGGILDAAREGDEAAGDPLGQDSAAAVLSGAADAWPAAELAAAAAEGMAPGQGLGYWAARFAPGQMSDYALPGAAAACRRLASWAQAAELALVAEVAARAATRDSSVPVAAGGLPGRVPDEAAAEVALALRMSQYGASCWTDLAITLAGRLAGTGAALRSGMIDLTRARLIAEATCVLDDRGAKLAEDKVLPGAGAKTAAQLRAALRRAVISVDPDAAERRRQDAERRAKVGLYGDEEGTATLSGQNLPGAHAAAAMARITALARAMKASGVGGGIDLLRAQVYIGLLLGTLPLIPPAEDAPPGGPDDPGDPGEPRGPGGPGAGNLGDPDQPGAPEGPADRGQDNPDNPDGPGGPGAGNLGDSDQPGAPGGPADRRGPDSPDGPADPGGQDDPGGQGKRGNRDDSGDPGGPVDLSEPPCPAGLCGSRDLNDPGGPGPAGPANPRDLAGSASLDDSGVGGQCRSRDPTWPDLPVPGQVRAGLAHSGTGALAGLPRGPAGRGLLRLTVPWRTLAGILAEPGQLSGLGAITPHTARHLADAASRDPGTRWRVIITDGGGQAIAVTRIRRSRARSAGSSPAVGLVSQVTLVVPVSFARDPEHGQPSGAAATSPGSALGSPGTQDSPQSQALGSPISPWPAGSPGIPSGEDALSKILAAALEAARLATTDTDTDETVAGPAGTGPGTTGSGRCAHRKSSRAYRPPPRLREFVAARDQTCRYPVCRQPASRADQDHTVPYDQGGRTCDCNLGGACRTHHRIKQRPGWQLTQREPGTFTWRTPAGRIYTQTPDPYLA